MRMLFQKYAICMQVSLNWNFSSFYSGTSSSSEHLETVGLSRAFLAYLEALVVRLQVRMSLPQPRKVDPKEKSPKNVIPRISNVMHHCLNFVRILVMGV